jgi:hypothetical protein
MKFIKLLMCFVSLGAAKDLVASDIFPKFEKASVNFAVPTNTPYCASDPKFLVGTNYIYKFDGQFFSNPAEGHIQTVAEGFSGKTDEGTPWKTLTELLAAYQNGSSENDVRALYDESSTNFLNMVYGSEQMKARFQTWTGSITGMQVVLACDYLGAYLAEVKLDYKDGHHEVTQFFFALKDTKYKLTALQITKPDPNFPDPSFRNIGVYLQYGTLLNKKSP